MGTPCIAGGGIFAADTNKAIATLRWYCILRKGKRFEDYRFIQTYHNIFGVRWLLRKFEIAPNTYYNFLKNRKADYGTQKQEILEIITEIYNEHNGVDGYRSMKVYLERKGYTLSNLTVHKYMNVELGLYSIVRKKRPDYRKGTAHHVFDNLLEQKFSANGINEKWCTGFTYLFLTDGSKRYNCSVLDLHDRSIVASVTDNNITADLAIRTLKKALESQKMVFPNLILHSDQGSQYTSKDFIEFCSCTGITQSMSKAGYPYDNAPMERYYNALKSELIYLHYYHNDDALNISIEEFAYVTCNHTRSHSYNGYKTLFEARYAAAE